MENDVIISFLVPTLGEREFEIRRLLNSLLCQTLKNIEIVIVVQGNHKNIYDICNSYSDLKITFVNSEKGLSKARNIGLLKCTGKYIVLSDDDCWYPEDAAYNIYKEIEKNNANVLLTQIYDFTNQRPYKTYKCNEELIKNKFELSKKSSIEIAFQRDFDKIMFDEKFGLGSKKFVCCEEVDFLLAFLKKNANIIYVPLVTVYHDLKYTDSTNNQIIAKGAFYAKNYNIFIGILICIKDLFFRKKNNFKLFFEGYFQYKKEK